MPVAALKLADYRWKASAGFMWPQGSDTWWAELCRQIAAICEAQLCNQALESWRGPLWEVESLLWVSSLRPEDYLAGVQRKRCRHRPRVGPRDSLSSGAAVEVQAWVREMNPRLSVLPPVVVGAVWERSTDERASSVTFSVCLIGFCLLVCVPFLQRRREARQQRSKKVGVRYYETHNVKNRNRSRKATASEGQKHRHQKARQKQ